MSKLFNSLKIEFEHYSRIKELEECVKEVIRDLEFSEKEMYNALEKEEISLRKVKNYLYLRLDYLNKELDKAIKDCYTTVMNS